MHPKQPPLSFERRRPSRLRPVVMWIIILALGYGIYHYWPFSHGADGGAPGGAAPVGVAEVIQRDVQVWSEFSGRLVAVDSAEIRARVSGTLDQVYFREGERVSKGQKLFTIDPRPYEAALEAASARAQLAESEFERAKMLLAADAISPHDYDQKKNDAGVARADLETARLNLEYTTIKAPIAGRVGRAEITVGNLVDAGGSTPVLTTLVSDRPIYADFDIDEQSFLRYLQATGGDRARLDKVAVALGLADEEGAPHAGHIQSFDNQLDVRSGTIRVRAVFDNADGALVPGLFAHVRIGSAGDTNALLITDRAVGTDQNKKYVYVVGADNKVEYREITLGATVDNLRIVESGLKAGEKIIVSGLQRAHPGAPVTPEVVPMEDKGSGIRDQESKNAKP